MEDDKITVVFPSGKTIKLNVEEYQPVEPSNYCWEAGWNCYSDEYMTEYFVSKSGIVYIQPDNIEVGIAPVVKEAADFMERLIDIAHAAMENEQ